MDVMKCSYCGCIGFAYSGRCKRCGQLMPVQNSRSSHSGLSNRLSPGFRKQITLLAMGAIFVGIIAGVVVVRAQLKKFFDPTPAYLEAIRKSGKFEEPTTIRVNQRPIPMTLIMQGALESRRTVLVAKTAKVLEALGLLTVSKTTSSSTWDRRRRGGSPGRSCRGCTRWANGWRPTARPYTGRRRAHTACRHGAATPPGRDACTPTSSIGRRTGDWR